MNQRIFHTDAFPGGRRRSSLRSLLLVQYGNIIPEVLSIRTVDVAWGRFRTTRSYHISPLYRGPVQGQSLAPPYLPQVWARLAAASPSVSQPAALVLVPFE